MADNFLTDWLLENGGPVVRYRTGTELLQDPTGIDMGRLSHNLLESPHVRLWLERLTPGRIHNSKNTDFENAMGKLLEFGLRAGMAPFDERTLHFRRWLATEAPRHKGMHSLLSKAIVAAGLARAGYSDAALRDFINQRLDDLYQTARKGTYDIYADPEAYSDVPKARQGQPIVKPEFYPQGELMLPSIHDMYAVTNFPSDMQDAAAKQRISTVVRYILHPEYQALPDGYGLLRAGRRRYYAIGWKVTLPGYKGFDFSDWDAGLLVQRIELMAHFPAAGKHPWLKNCMEHLESFRTPRGTYLFPRRYLREKREGYWVSGAHMGLEENRRSSRALEIESTFRMLTIKQLKKGAEQGGDDRR
jgi:hypothetical protein